MARYSYWVIGLLAFFLNCYSEKKTSRDEEFLWGGQSVTDLKKQFPHTPQEQFQNNIYKNKMFLYGTYGVDIGVPGINYLLYERPICPICVGRFKWSLVFEKKIIISIYPIQGTADTVINKTHERFIEEASAYAEAYNPLVESYMKELFNKPGKQFENLVNCSKCGLYYFEAWK